MKIVGLQLVGMIKFEFIYINNNMEPELHIPNSDVQATGYYDIALDQPVEQKYTSGDSPEFESQTHMSYIESIKEPLDDYPRTVLKTLQNSNAVKPIAQYPVNKVQPDAQPVSLSAPPRQTIQSGKPTSLEFNPDGPLVSVETIAQLNKKPKKLLSCC